MKVAVIHDWLVAKGGAEKVLHELLILFPDADLYTTVCHVTPDEMPLLRERRVFTSFIQRLPFSKTKYRMYLGLMPIAIEQFDFSAYDLVISSSYAVAKGIITGPDQTHVAYVHSPARYAWDLQGQYLKDAGLERGIKSLFARYILHRFRIWDVRTSHGIDHWICNSKFIAKRVKKIYGVSPQVIYPPISTEKFTFSSDKKGYYLTASRLVPYKKVRLIVEAFALMPDKKLVVIGDGPEMADIQKASQENVEVLGFQSETSLISYMQQAKAFIFAAEEDFGIVPLEAQACGTPVLAFGKGGSLETVSDGRTGFFFYAQTTSAICETLARFEASGLVIDEEVFRRHVERFSRESFSSQIKQAIEAALSRRSDEGREASTKATSSGGAYEKRIL